MSLLSLLDKPCTLVRRTEGTVDDGYGNLEPDTTQVETVCDLQQQQRDEPGAAGELSVTKWLLILPTGTEIDTGDAVVVGGKVYEVTGQPWDATEGSSEMHHVEATVVKTAGESVGS